MHSPLHAIEMEYLCQICLFLKQAFFCPLFWRWEGAQPSGTLSFLGSVFSFFLNYSSFFKNPSVFFFKNLLISSKKLNIFWKMDQICPEDTKIQPFRAVWAQKHINLTCFVSFWWVNSSGGLSFLVKSASVFSEAQFFWAEFFLAAAHKKKPDY